MITIYRNDKIAFQEKINTLQELKQIFNTIKEKDQKYGTFSYTIENVELLVQKELLDYARIRVEIVLNEYGYYSLGDVQYYANQNDAEAQGLLNWYQAYDDAIWAYIDNDLQTFTTVDELLILNLRQVEQQIFDQAVQSAPLP